MRIPLCPPTRSLPRRHRATRARRLSLEYLEGRAFLSGLTVLADPTINDGATPVVG
jgi:hypothetical protein